MTFEKYERLMFILIFYFVNFAYFSYISCFYTNSITAILLASPPLRGSLVIRVYPPALFSYRGAMRVTIFCAPSALPSRDTKIRRDATDFFFPLVTNFSTNGRSSFAFASVVVIFSCRISESARPLRSARRTPTSLPNFLFVL